MVKRTGLPLNQEQLQAVIDLLQSAASELEGHLSSDTPMWLNHRIWLDDVANAIDGFLANVKPLGEYESGAANFKLAATPEKRRARRTRRRNR